VIHPKIKIENDLENLLVTTKKVTDWHDLLFIDEAYERWTVYFMTLIRQCGLEATHDICEHLTVAPRYTAMFAEQRCRVEKQLFPLENHAPMDNATIFNLLHGFRTELILHLMVCSQSETAKRRISRYHTHLRHVTIATTGKDLLKMGFSPGPIFSRTLQMVLNAKLNGRVKTREDEVAFIERHVLKSTHGNTDPSNP